MNTTSERKWATPMMQSPTIRPQQQAKGSGSTGLKTAQRHTVRLALLTGAVIAALIGAQALALLDNSVAAQPTQAVVIPANVNQ